MKHQSWDLNQTWPVVRKCCRFINAPLKFRGPSPEIMGGGQKTQTFRPLFCNLRTRRRISWEQNVERQINILVSIYNVSPTNILTFVIFHPETTEICLLIVTHPMKTTTVRYCSVLSWHLFWKTKTVNDRAAYHFFIYSITSLFVVVTMTSFI